MSDSVVVALIAGGVALFVALLTNFVGEAYRRHRDARALAGGLAGELAAYMKGAQIVRQLWPVLLEAASTGKALVFPRISPRKSPVFERSVEKIGLLGPEVCEDLAFTYANVEAFRGMMQVVAETEDARLQAQCISSALLALERFVERGEPLIAELRRIASGAFNAIDLQSRL